MTFRDATDLRRPLRLVVLLALSFAATPVLARDPCADVTQAVAQLRDPDSYQLAAQLFAAARHGCEDDARTLIDRGAAVDARDREGATALAVAAKANKTKMAAFLLDRGADVNARAVNGSTPLFFAAEADRPAVAALLLERGADPNLPGRTGLTPLDAAAYNGSEDEAKALLVHGADPVTLDDAGKAPMVYAAGRGNTAMVALLLDAGVDVNRRYGHDLTALMWTAGHDAAAGIEDIEATIALLLKRGAAKDLKDDRGMTAAEIARALGRDREASLLAP